MTGDTGNPWRPYTRSEWDALRKRTRQVLSGGYLLNTKQLARVEATIENGFAPEPIDEDGLRRWAYCVHGKTDVLPAPFDGSDLDTAFERAREVELWVSFRADDPTGYAVNVGNRNVWCRDLGSVARTVAALAFRKRKGEDVSHLIGDAR